VAAAGLPLKAVLPGELPKVGLLVS